MTKVSVQEDGGRSSGELDRETEKQMQIPTLRPKSCRVDLWALYVGMPLKPIIPDRGSKNSLNGIPLQFRQIPEEALNSSTGSSVGAGNVWESGETGATGGTVFF
jgi:hypothetical protein